VCVYFTFYSQTAYSIIFSRYIQFNSFLSYCSDSYYSDTHEKQKKEKTIPDVGSLVIEIERNPMPDRE